MLRVGFGFHERGFDTIEFMYNFIINVFDDLKSHQCMVTSKVQQLL